MVVIPQDKKKRELDTHTHPECSREEWREGEEGERRGHGSSSSNGPVSSHFYRWASLSPVSSGSIPLVPEHNGLCSDVCTHTHRHTHTGDSPAAPSSSSHKLGQPLPHPRSNRCLGKCSLLSTAPTAASQTPELLEGAPGQGSGAKPSARGWQPA